MSDPLHEQLAREAAGEVLSRVGGGVMYPSDVSPLILSAIDRAVEAEREANRSTDAFDLSRCPTCGGPADNGHDRESPPNPYECSKCATPTDKGGD